MEENSYLSILEELGYPLKRVGNHIVSRAVYRSGDKVGSIAIYSDTASYYDFVACDGGPLSKLIKLTLNLNSEEKLEEWLKNKNIQLSTPVQKPQIKTARIYPPELLKKLGEDYSYWEKRGIDVDVLKRFRGGVTYEKGKLGYRYVFPIFNSSQKIIGWAGRALKDDQQPKWIIIGPKMEYFAYPLFLNYKTIQKTRRIILTEGISDVLSFFSCGIEDVVCLFGVEIGTHLLKTIIKLNVNKIILALNNDESKETNVGLVAAEKIKDKLLNYFDPDQIEIRLPRGGKDVNELLNIDKNLVIEQYGYENTI